VSALCPQVPEVVRPARIQFSIERTRLPPEANSAPSKEVGLAKQLSGRFQIRR
jgi:hypothetical protein